MPPKKRTSTVANADATEPSSKRVRKSAGPGTAAASRPKRFPQLPPRAAKIKAAAPAPAPAPKPSPAKRAATSKAQAQETPRKRGRPAATAASPAVKKGKPAKSTAPAKKATAPKPKTTTPIVKTKTTPTGKPGKRRGRPPKSAEPTSTQVAGKKRKRTAGESKQESATVPQKSSTGKLAKKQKVTRAPRTPAFLKEKEPGLTIEVAEEDAFGSDGKSYWLMKAEPESRIVKGVDVKFSIDDLRATREPEPWDGVRNSVARNNMRAMKQGDYAFFYHSSCKVPGIVGQMEIVKEHSVDESAFDPAHPYYDEKSSRENPKWECVHVEFRRKFDQTLTLETLKSYGFPGQPLENMQTLRQSRVSVSRVSPQEWNFIMGLIDKQEAGAKKASAKAAAKEAKAAAKEAAATDNADTEMKDAAEPKTQVNGEAETAENTTEAPKEPTTEDAPRSEHDAPEEPAAEPEATSTFPAPVDEQLPKGTSQPEDKPEDQMDHEKSTGSGINGQTTAERITSVFTSAFLAN
ncbi:hypothetical protein EYB26_007991 [Talaromyces marneffei]|uniref:uncharacterized protein n=1 Tax=Talaromyces marneffei TaxID=37727 RepID=UPI0012A7B04F|nr:uncharacterized protein EYB26_007991 [Talaromyces marneffei]QGA20289.1 hypothetical protein EYB26_007991 [Talaromyces marneffei]